jgi:hypothetical protein
MKVHFLPKTRPGRWSTWLIVAFIVFIGLFYIFIATGQRGGATFFSNLYLTVPAVMAAIAGIAAFFTGVFGVIKSRDRAILVYPAILIGLFVLLFCLGEIIFPH